MKLPPKEIPFRFMVIHLLYVFVTLFFTGFQIVEFSALLVLMLIFLGIWGLTTDKPRVLWESFMYLFQLGIVLIFTALPDFFGYGFGVNYVSHLTSFFTQTLFFFCLVGINYLFDIKQTNAYQTKAEPVEFFEARCSQGWNTQVAYQLGSADSRLEAIVFANELHGLHCGCSHIIIDEERILEDSGKTAMKDRYTLDDVKKGVKY